MGWYSPKKGLLLGSLFLLLSLAGCLKSAPEPVELRGRAMGTSYKILYLPTAETPEESEVQGMVALTLSQVEQKMSTYLKDSELSKLNQAVKPGVYPVSKETYRVLSEALTLGLESGGALDITVMPLVDLWGFGPTEQKGIPPEDQIQEALAKTGLDKLALDPKGGQIQKKTSNLTLDLSSIAKGYGVDQVSDLLKNLEIKNHMVEIGGEIRVLGERPGGGAWRIGIEEPVPEGGVNRVVELSDQSMATSGDYRNFFSEGGKNYSHTIDPHTGRPVIHDLTSVSVIHSSCMTADGWATALMVLGEKKGFQLAEKKGLAAYFIYRDKDSLKTRGTAAFNQLLNPEAGE